MCVLCLIHNHQVPLLYPHVVLNYETMNHIDFELYDKCNISYS